MTTTTREQDLPIQELERVTIRFAGDSGDGMQLTGTQFTRTAAVFGNDISTLPDFPAEIRAPAGSLPGVSGFQISFSSMDIHTPGDQPDVLVAMNPAALKTNIGDLPAGGALIVNSDAFSQANLNKAAYASNPLTDGSLKAFTTFEIPISTLNERSLEGLEMTSKQKDLTKNFFALGIMFWLYERSMDPTIHWIDTKFSARPVIAEANKRALKAGYAFGETTEMFHTHFRVKPAKLAPGTYRNITGNEATALGFLAASKLADRPLFYGSYPITPASDILHQLSGYKAFGVKTFQAEDEIAAIGAAIGASYGGALGLTASSGPGIALKTEAMGLAVMVELPLVVIDVQRAGPSTGMPTKNEQADLLQVMFGRNSDSPVPIVAPATPGECFDYAIEAWRLALKYMTPVVYLSDAFLATGSEPWRIPSVADLPSIAVRNATRGDGPFRPYERDPDTLARPWAVPGTAGLEHRIGGLEKADITGNVSYDPDNHHRMQMLRAAKVAGIADDIGPLEVFGPGSGDLLVLGWGSTYGAIRSAVERLQAAGRSVAHAHLRHLNPFPANTEEVLRSYRRVLIPEVNLGQLLMLVRAKYLIDAVGYDRVRGKPFRISEIVAEAERVLGVTS
ncbi:MAG TPA: 2-oxoacid:acceptor oxidoreductase subunit alpha [Candidatus Limnocylindrales bacterium]|jgi:2-oxoglutarate ferredoxin oxidoreductase subunit alpha|nr:2-oxoacid:acceptor oxidoreductase subunit alpha [Candidatus Limnocylindrales bacterium]